MELGAERGLVLDDIPPRTRLPCRLGADADHRVVAPTSVRLLEPSAGTEEHHPRAARLRSGLELLGDVRQAVGMTDGRAGDSPDTAERRVSHNGVAALREPEPHAGVEDLIRDGVPAEPQHEVPGGEPFRGHSSMIATEPPE